MIVFSVSALDKSPVTLNGFEDVEFFELEEDDPLTVCEKLEYTLTAAKVSGGVLVSGKCVTAVCGICGRCLEDVTFPVEADIELFFEVGENQEELDVSSDIREEVVLAFPMNLLCSSECAGLCRNCGANLNRNECSCGKSGGSGDFRWGALDDLKL